LSTGAEPSSWATHCYNPVVPPAAGFVYHSMVMASVGHWDWQDWQMKQSSS
jgi:hypothetical protein